MSAVCSAQSQMLEGERAPAAHFVKTKICKFNLRGKCTRGEACRYAHDVEEMAPLPDLSYTRLCKSFLRSAMCSSGDSCTFAHSADELRNNHAIPGAILHEKIEQSPNSTLLKVDMCKFFRQGRCLLGKSCTFAHGDDELQQRPNLYRTSACFAFWKGKCKAGDDCKYSHSLDIAPRDEAKCSLDIAPKEEALEVEKAPTADLDMFDVDFFSRQTTCGTILSSPSRDLDNFPTQWSRQTSWADMEDEDIQVLWSRQVSLDSNVNPPTQWSRQTSWADMEDEDIQTLWSRQVSLDSNVNLGKDSVDCHENNAVASPIQVSDIDDGLKSHQTSLVDADAEETSLSGSESTGATSSVGRNDRLVQEGVGDQCARLRNISGLSGLQVSVKNTFLAFDDHDRQVLSGTASLRARSFA